MVSGFQKRKLQHRNSYKDLENFLVFVVPQKLLNREETIILQDDNDKQTNGSMVYNSVKN